MICEKSVPGVPGFLLEVPIPLKLAYLIAMLM